MKTKNASPVRQLVPAALFLALAFVLPRVETCSSGMGYSSSACSCASGSWAEAVI